MGLRQFGQGEFSGLVLEKVHGLERSGQDLHRSLLKPERLPESFKRGWPFCGQPAEQTKVSHGRREEFRGKVPAKVVEDGGGIADRQVLGHRRVTWEAGKGKTTCPGRGWVGSYSRFAGERLHGGMGRLLAPKVQNTLKPGRIQ